MVERVEIVPPDEWHPLQVRLARANPEDNELVFFADYFRRRLTAVKWVGGLWPVVNPRGHKGRPSHPPVKEDYPILVYNPGHPYADVLAPDSMREMERRWRERGVEMDKDGEYVVVGREHLDHLVEYASDLFGQEKPEADPLLHALLPGFIAPGSPVDGIHVPGILLPKPGWEPLGTVKYSESDYDGAWGEGIEIDLFSAKVLRVTLDSDNVLVGGSVSVFFVLADDAEGEFEYASKALEEQYEEKKTDRFLIVSFSRGEEE